MLSYMLKINTFRSKTVKFNKYKHKRSPWITNGILRSLKFRDNLYKSLKCTMIDTPLYYTRKHNLRVYNQILDRNIRSLKKEYHCRQFANFKNDTKMTWAVIRSVLHMNKNKKDFPSFFIINNLKVTSKCEIAERFNSFFASIGSKLATKASTRNINS